MSNRLYGYSQCRYYSDIDYRVQLWEWVSLGCGYTKLLSKSKIIVPTENFEIGCRNLKDEMVYITQFISIIYVYTFFK